MGNIRKFVKKPALVDAVQWTGTLSSTKEVLAFLGEYGTHYEPFSDEEDTIHVKLENGGVKVASPGCWLVQHKMDSFDVLDRQLFARLYTQLTPELSVAGVIREDEPSLIPPRSQSDHRRSKGDRK